MRRHLTPLPLALALAACGSDDVEETVGAVPVDPENFSCTLERNLWEQCVDGTIEWCHATVGAPHFHSGARCESLGLDCLELEGGSRAVCTDPTLVCNAGDYSCDGNTALNCRGGVTSVRPCGTREVCLVDDAASVATCWDERSNAPCDGHGDLYPDGCNCDFGYEAIGNNRENCAPKID